MLAQQEFILIAGLKAVVNVFLQGRPGYLVLHQVGSVQTVHAVCPEHALLRRNDAVISRGHQKVPGIVQEWPHLFYQRSQVVVVATATLGVHVKMDHLDLQVKVLDRVVKRVRQHGFAARRTLAFGQEIDIAYGLVSIQKFGKMAPHSWQRRIQASRYLYLLVHYPLLFPKHYTQICISVPSAVSFLVDGLTGYTASHLGKCKTLPLRTQYRLCLFFFGSICVDP